MQKLQFLIINRYENFLYSDYKGARGLEVCIDLSEIIYMINK